MPDAVVEPLQDEQELALTLQYRLDEQVALIAAAPYRHVERWEVTVLMNDPAPESKVEVGHARVLIVNLEPGDDIAEFADTATGTWIERATTARPSHDADDPTSASEERQLASHVLVLEQVWLRPEARGRGLGPIVAAAVIERLGRGCHLAACYPAPFETPDQDADDHARSVKALGKLWSKVGFTHWRDGVWMLNPNGDDRHDVLAALLAGRPGHK